MAQMNEKLKSLVRGLFEDKQALKELDASVTKDSNELKKWMGDKKVDQMDVDSIHVTYSPQVRSTMDEGKTLEILRQLAADADDNMAEQILGCIKTREYVDEEELENLIYNEIISKDAWEPAVQSKTIFVLKMRKLKAKD